MDIVKLNSLSEIHRLNRCEVTFNELYHEAVRLFQRMNREVTRASGSGDEHDADSHFNDTFMELSKRDDLISFGATFSKALSLCQLEIGRGNGRRRKRFALAIDSDESEDNEVKKLLYLAEGYPSAEEIVFERLKEADQRQLIDSITRSVKTSTTMTSIIEAYETAPLNASPNAIAKSLGIHHETVSRKLRKLGRQFDMNRFGDIRDIIAV